MTGIITGLSYIIQRYISIKPLAFPLVCAAALSACVIYPEGVYPPAEKSLDLNGRTALTVETAWFGQADTLRLTLSGTQNKRLVALKLNPGPNAIPYGDSGSLSFVFAHDKAKAQADARTPPALDDAAPLRPHPLPHRPSLEWDAAKDGSSAAAKSLLPTSEALKAELNQTTYFWVENRQGAFTTIEAELSYISASAYFWVATSGESGETGLSSGFDIGALTLDRIKLLANAFDTIKPRLNAIFGYESGGELTGDGGEDGDKYISILLYDIDFDYAEAQASGVYGYYWSKDEADATPFPTEGTSPPPGVTPSNGREMFYLDAPFVQLYPYAQVSTLAHEYQHMISYNENYGAWPSTWINELYSLTAEDLMESRFQTDYRKGYLGDDDPGYQRDYDGAYYRALRFVKGDYLLAGLDSAWGFGTEDYSAAYLFGAYLSRAYGGAPFLSAAYKAGPELSALIGVIRQACSGALSGVTVHEGAFQPPENAADYGVFLKTLSLALFGLGADEQPEKSPLLNANAPASTSSQDTLLPLDLVNNPLGHFFFLSYSDEGELPARGLSFHHNSLYNQDDIVNVDTISLAIIRPEAPGSFILLFI